MKTELKEFLENEGYCHLTEINGRGVCGVMRFMFTYGLVYGLDESGYKGRYCFDNAIEAAVSLAVWSGSGDPSGKWIKHKGDTEYSNPNLISDHQSNQP